MEEKREKISETMREKVTNGVYKHPQGLDYIKESIIKTCPICNKEFVSKRRKTVFCSRECAQEARREDNLKNKGEYHIYYLMCKFQFSLNMFPNEFNFGLVEENGWYEATNRGNNLKGVSRDHMFSINEGYKQGIDPYYISHPANCQLMKQEDNFKKLTNCSITKEELFKRVKD